MRDNRWKLGATKKTENNNDRCGVQGNTGSIRLRTECMLYTVTSLKFQLFLSMEKFY